MRPGSATYLTGATMLTVAFGRLGRVPPITGAALPIPIWWALDTGAVADHGAGIHAHMAVRGCTG